MKPPLSYYVVSGLLVLLGYLFGYFSGGRSGTSAPQPLLNAPPLTAAHQDNSIDIGTDIGRERPEPVVALTPEQARARTFELLSLPDRFERMRQLCDLLRGVTTDNWRDIIDVFVRQTASTGRRHPDEWRLTLARVGEIAGAAAVEEMLASAKQWEQGRAPALLAGWAAGDPKAAQAWLASQDPERQKLLGPGLVNGLARSEPDAALAVMQSFAGMRDTLVPQIMDETIQRGGFRAGEELLMRTFSRTDVPADVKGALFYHIGMREIEMARFRGEPEAVLDWADSYVARDLVMGPATLKEIVAFSAQADAPATLAWIEARSDKWAPEHHSSGIWPAIATAMLAQAPEQFAKWMEAHRDHPQRDQIARAVAQQLAKRGDYEQARQWSVGIQDPTIRASVEKDLDTSRAHVH